MKKLVLLGAWDVPPLLAWPWFAKINNESIFSRYNPKCVTCRQNRLHYQYLFDDSIENIRKDLEKLSKAKQVEFMNAVSSEIFKFSKGLFIILDGLKDKKIDKMTAEECISQINRINNSLVKFTFDIWFILLLDIWYPYNHVEIKKLGAKARDHSGHVNEKTKLITEKIAARLSFLLNVEKSLILYLFPEELYGLLRSKNCLSKAKSRQKFFVTTNLSGKYQIFEGKKAAAQYKKYVPQDNVQTVNELKGMPASPGFLKGKVRVVLLHSEFEYFHKGEILVALQTMVNYIPVMQRSSAILTEFGGMTSHAAIVAREMKKPCIVGIKGLTSALKTGDIIEVNANKGTIKIIKTERYSR